MISELSGNVANKNERYLVLDVHGVGYKVFSTAETIEKIKAGVAARLFTHLSVRENALDLYGFVSKEELDFFELLISISGIGPKTALSILNLATISTLEKAISSGDSSYLTKVAGIGKKNAEKIILELKDRLTVTFDASAPGSAQSHEDTIEALKALGYAEREAREALKKVPPEVSDTGARVKYALKILSK